MSCKNENFGILKADGDPGILKNVIKGKTYRIPKYQRGYRWTEPEVTKLLEDVFEGWTPDSPAATASPAPEKEENAENGEDREDKNTYCIQPLVVVKDEDSTGVYHVIDGQQRLTTLAIILAAINYHLGNDDKEQEYKINITYESREKSRGYLERLYSAPKPEEGENGENIDYAHMWEAYKTAIKFFEGKPKETITAQREFLLSNTRFIWYEPELKDRSEQSEQKIFTDFNTGKIELTNSELIKAVFMDPARLGGSGRDIKNAQVVISERWDEIENRLREPELWAFIPHGNIYQYKEDPDAGYANRIEVLFRLFAVKNEIPVNKNAPFGLYEAIETQINDEFNHNRDKGKADLLLACWDKITLVFHELLDLYSQNNIYNLAGLYMYLLRDKKYEERYKRLCEVIHEPRDKREAKLKKLIGNELFSNCTDKDRKAWLKGLRYNTDSKRNINRVMLAYNVSLLLSTTANNSRYSFAAHANEAWEREHIFAQHTDASESADELKRNAVRMLHSFYSDDSGEKYEEYIKYLFGNEDTPTIEDIYTEALRANVKNISLVERTSKKELERMLLGGEVSSVTKDFTAYGYAVRALHAREEFARLHDYYQRIDRIEEMLREDMPEELRYLLIKRYFEEFTDIKGEEGTIQIQFHDQYKALISELTGIPAEKSGSGPTPVADSFKAEFGLELDIPKGSADEESDPTDRESLVKAAVDDAFRKRQEQLLELLKKPVDSINPDEIRHIRKLLELSKTTMQGKIDKFFQHDGSSAFADLLADNSLGNMSLLPKTANSGISNGPFYEKRRDIISRISDSSFIPIGTTLVFYGAFSHGPAADNFWLPESRLEYLRDVIDKICGLCGL